MTAPSRWFDEVKAWPVADVAARFGLEVVRRGADVSFPCRVCGKDRRHSRGVDPRKAVKVMPDNRWWCEPCGAGGDVVALVAAIAMHTPSPQRHQWREVREACVSVGLVAGERLGKAPIPVSPPSAPPPHSPAQRVSRTELEAFWRTCGPISPTSPAGRYLVARGLLAPGAKGVAVAPWLDVVREAPSTLATPCEWWSPAWLQRWPLVFPVYDGQGRLASIQARAIERSTEPKTRWPYRRSASGLLFADSMGLTFLRSRAQGEAVDGLEAVVIAEGATDTLKLSRLAESTTTTLAVLGYVAGSKHALAGVDWPHTVPCLVATDDDEVGDRYAAEIRRTLDWRVSVYRVKTPQGRNSDGSKVADWSDCTDADVIEALATSSRWEACHG